MPPPGSYPIVPPPAFDDEDVLEDGAGWLFVEIVAGNGTEGLFWSESGTLLIEASSPSDIYGRLSFETASSEFGTFGPLTGSGEFRADASSRIDLDARAGF